MDLPAPPKPLELAHSLGVPPYEVAVRLGITTDWLRRLARNPRHTRRIRVAELEAVLERERLALSLESLTGGHA
jgi:hypothetical protein